MTTRVFLGIFEAGFGPAIPLYFCKLSIVPGFVECRRSFLQRFSTRRRKWAYEYVQFMIPSAISVTQFKFPRSDGLLVRVCSRCRSLRRDSRVWNTKRGSAFQ